ncbi:serine kinase of the HPr protein, regulates carbohydrate metabolism [Beggiatoa alba B18LD]|uniref:Serine kinase of the HPr protein, regulates carbohydrate metabolism n=1 Tax=Beggiatoa alba B18LD TaxID=395493 RepID=I3CJ81_9GAMM|nr:HPr(Ser) kinase/phosphatase [Beggiatoa alba]EIJ43674.1 serine kinase of the HPr protein, regulates carbohydrate metabolism [Beggiatoa alba B18LD]
MTLLSVTELYENHADNLGLHWLAGKENNRFLQLQTDQRIGNVGYLNLIHPHQIQVISLYELAYLEALSDNVYEDALKQLFENANLACIIVVDSPRVPDDLKRYAEHYHVPLFTSQVSGETLMNYLHGILGRMSGEKITLHGVFLDVFGMGVLITGDSGTGKSELALELVSRGHRLVADDAPEFSRIDHGVIRGTCPVQGMTPFLEVRGLGILNVQALFGDSAIKKDKYLRLIVKLEHMSSEQLRQIDRLQGDYRSRQVLGVEIPEVGLPVAAGRNLAVLLECAVRNHSLKMQGYNAADEFCQRQTRAMYNMDKDEGYVSHRFDVY